MFTMTKINRVLSEIHVSSEKKYHVVLFHVHSSFVLSPDFWCGKQVDCRMFFDFLATTRGNRHLLFMADGAWVPWTEPMNLMAVQSAWPPGMHVWNIYKTLQLMGSLTYLSTGAGFLSVKSTASHLAIARFSHTSLTDQYGISQMWCQGDQGRSKQWRRSLRLKLKKELWQSSFVSKQRQLPVSCASLLTETYFFPKGLRSSFFLA